MWEVDIPLHNPRRCRTVNGMGEHFTLAVQHAHTAGSSGLTIPILIILAVGVFLGLRWGRRRALKQLGEYEYRQRWTNVNKIRRW